MAVIGKLEDLILFSQACDLTLIQNAQLNELQTSNVLAPADASFKCTLIT
jgi:hypothetical protein